MGATGAGKSSFICYLTGAKLEFKRVRGSYHIINPSKEDYPAIGNSSESCTSIPGAYGNFIDSAGFLDTNGPKQETINSYATAKIFKRGTKLKIVVIVEYSSLKSAKGKILVDVANRLFELFPVDFHKLLYSIVLVISKVNTEED